MTITESQFVFKEPDKTKIVIQKQPGHDNFDNLDADSTADPDATPDIGDRDLGDNE